MRAKIIYGCAVLLAVILGFGSRVFAERLPEFVSSHFGDALWAAMLNLLSGLLWTRLKLGLALLLSLGSSYGIEFSLLNYSSQRIYIYI
ncbi:DUF2809 domain-containing protein [Paenibacillus sp. S150]|uniref:DUF2809 domain-containing protein n=1 Tax=Paenibacillus sp. S150 TaxID=2749826 RepID=UPI001C59A668|nr:DUF2809 domain-containing protein [Paenibacillus sp. S150]MBW4085823.1 hypothetical protein [Paenibacillus sp. S150]